MTDDLFSPLELRGTEIPNRVMVSPMCQYSCEDRDGLATEWHRTHLGARATGRAGVVMTEATAVEPRGRISPEDLGIWSGEHADALAPITEFIRSQGSVPAIQLAHAGRKASTRRPWEGRGPLQPDEGGWNVVAPSAIPYPGHESPVEVAALSREEIARLVETFADAAGYALDAGFEIAEIHAAHGYLLHEFLSPVANDRDDEYGGSFENRIRFPLEVTAAVRDIWPDDRPLFVRLSGTDWLPDRESWTVEQSARLADRLADAGVDLIDVSSGGIHPDQQLPPSGPNYQVPLAEHVREHTSEDVGIGAVGGITTPEGADALIRNDRADLAIVGREFLRDPQFPLRAARELDALDRIDVPPQYERAF
ncbi:NADH:flavin oxidoreductase/NADH oxidase [Natranaeroarchaeum sulfidigenes]|uniref:NADH:flavin oxidoreductase, Old Yellow Enzyme family n=1 Tax=Natranaeroarchaeum sulfidigenes TaxID=2784880 RepID=A0A897MUZ7_9EURY|nr:NADH:flavin oxidoreductase/NADH oxidase [Natranaeroarchaeum sulfidigenes]QSG04334.1 NADH:flavin oxidoreductase, Old Yellow Enzyme family [Natranaeroarchaeum sulfidigenes]